MEHKDAKKVYSGCTSKSNTVMLVVCKKIIIGEVNIIPESDVRLHWLVINSATKCLSVLDSMESEPLEGTQHPPCEVFSVTGESTQLAKIYREGSELVIQLKTITSPRFLQPLELLDECGCDISFTISPGGNYPKINKMLREIFGDKCQSSLDIKEEISLVDELAELPLSSDEESRYLSPYSARCKRTGYVVRRKTLSQRKSLSSVSSASLALLRDKLEELPHIVFNKQRESVCTNPNLSRITESSEENARSIEDISSRSRVKPCGVVHKGIIKDTNCKARSLPPIINDENSTSLILVATVGTSNKTVINDTIDFFSKNKSSSTDNIVDSLIKEALRGKKVSEQVDSDNDFSKSNDTKCDNSEIIENTQAAELHDQFVVKNVQAVKDICDSTKNDSEGSPVNFITFRKKNKSNSITNVLNIETDKLIPYENEDEPQSTKKDREVIRTDSSNNFLLDDNEIDIIECINSIVDTVCINFDKCAQYLHKTNLADITMPNKKSREKHTSPRSSVDPEVLNKPESKICVSSKQKPVAEKMKIKFNFNKKKRITKKQSANKAYLEKTPNKSFNRSNIVDHNSEGTKKANIVNEFINANPSKSRKKRKLYSPKDDQNNMSKPYLHIPETEDDTTLSEFKTSTNVTPKSRQNTYKEIVNERQKSNCRLRTPKAKTSYASFSKHDKLDEIFDKLKDDSSHDQPVNLINPKSSAKDLAVYNYTSESDDDEFRESAIYKRLSATTIDSVESTKTRRGRIINRINYSESKSNVSADKLKSVQKNKKKRNVVERKNSKRYVVNHNDLVDEKVRDAGPDILDTSLLTEKISLNLPNKDEDPVISTAPKIEAIVNEIYCETNNPSKTEPSRTEGKIYSKTEKKKSNKKGKKNTRDTQIERVFSPLIDLDNRTESPLPGLFIEAKTVNEDINDSLTINMIEKFKEICKGCAEPEKLNTSKTVSENNRLDDSALNFVNDETLVLNCVSESNEYVKSHPSPSPKNIIPESDLILIKTNNPNLKLARIDKLTTKKSKNKARSQSRKSESNEGKISERSYLTIDLSSIRARRNSDERPPSIESLEKTIQPRDLEIEYLNQSEISFLNKLRQAPYRNLTKKSSHKSDQSEKNSSSAELVNDFEGDQSEKNSSSAELVNDFEGDSLFKIEQLSHEKKLSQNFPLPRNLEYNESNSPSNTLIKNNKSVLNQEEKIQKSISPVHKSLKHTVIDIVSSNYDFRSNDSILNPQTPQRKNYSRKTTETKSRCDELSSSKNSDKQSNYKSDSRPNSTENSKTQIYSKDTQSQDESKYINKLSYTKRRSLISPVKSFDDIVVLNKDLANNLKGNRVIHINNDENIDSNNEENKVRIKKNILKFPTREVEDVIEEILDDTEGEIARPKCFEKYKRRSSEANKLNAKKRKLNIRDKYVKNWIESQQGIGETVEDIRNDAKEFLQSLVEKVDTTLEDMNENTTQSLVQYLVNCNKRGERLKEEFHKLYKQTARDILSEFTKVLDTKFSELNRKSQEESDALQKQIKQNAIELVKKDAQKRRVFVNILKEDLQVVLDRMNKRPKTDD